MDNELREAVAELLQADATLLGMLPKNENWFDQNVSDQAEKWSIVPLEKFKHKNPLPQITIQGGGQNRVGTNLYEDIFYIRCYNSSSKTFVEITDILARVRELLHKRQFQLAGSTSIELVHETTQAELVDQAYDLPFRESRYRWQRV
jgi:hypothetical protein